MTKTSVLLLAPSLFLAAAAGAGAETVGNVGAANQSVRGTPPGRAARPLSVGVGVENRERIETSAVGSAQIVFRDTSTMTIGRNSAVTIDHFVYDANAGAGRQGVSMAKGVLRFVGGGVSHGSGAALKTPTATIGVRGTDHEPTVIAAGDPRGEAGTYDKVNEGRTVLQTGPHAVEVGANQAAFQASSGAARPRVLPSVPAFFKPTPNEQRFVARSREVRETLDTRRIDRREAVRRGPDGRREPPSKAAPASTRSGAPSHSVGPGAAATREPSPSLHGSKAAPGGPAEKRAGSEGRAGSAAPRSGRPPGSSSVPATSNGSKGPSQHGRAVELDNARAGRPNAKQHEETGERRAPQGATGHKK